MSIEEAASLDQETFGSVSKQRKTRLSAFGRLRFFLCLVAGGNKASRLLLLLAKPGKKNYTGFRPSFFFRFSCRTSMLLVD